MSKSPPFLLPPMPRVKAYWWKGTSQRPNWGDWLTPLLLSRYSHLEASWTERGAAEVVVVGSVLGHIIGPWFQGTILGAGKLFKEQVVPKNANILALRGPLTAKGVYGDFVIGDPGLLADELVTIDTKDHDLCIVPHFSDKVLAQDPQFTKWDHVVVDPYSDPLDVVRLIAKSQKVVSSSLHGLILADAFNIPRRVEATADWIKEGGLFKVEDHNRAVGLSTKVGVLQEADHGRVADLRTDLRDAFNDFGKLYL